MTQKKIDRIAILGLGALGSLYGSLLQKARPCALKVIADRNRISRYRETSFTVNGEACHFEFADPEQDPFPADLILVAVKYPQLQEGIRSIKKFTGPQTVILSLLNGISSEETIGREVGQEHLLYAYGVGMDAVRTGTSVHYTNMGKIVFGERINQTLSPRVQAVKELFDEAGIPCLVPEQMLYALWSKFMLNVGVNQTSAILKAPYAWFQKESEARALMILAAREVMTISVKCGIRLTENDLQMMLTIIGGLDPRGKTSMLQDIEAGRKTEVEIFAGTVVELGQKLKVPTPVNELFFRIIRGMEQLTSVSS